MCLNEVFMKFYNAKNYIHDKFYVRLQRRQRWKTMKQLLFPVVMGDEAIAITSSCVRGHLDIKKYGTQASNMN